MRIRPPTFPLSAEAFESALRTGHGRALQHVSRFGAAGLETQVIEACRTSWAYDAQCEANRAPWLARILEQSQLQQRALEAMEACARPPTADGHWDYRQRCGIARELARAGLPGARELLYSMFSRVPNRSDVLGAEEIISLDGVAGLKHVARAEGRWLKEDPTFWIDEHLVEYLDTEVGEQVGAQALELAAASDADIARYLAATREESDEVDARANDRQERLSLGAADLVARVRENPAAGSFWLRSWGRNARAEDLESVFEALLHEQEPVFVARLLWCFAWADTPRFDDKLIEWMNHADEDVSWPATEAAARLSHPRVREQALESIQHGDLATGATLLMRNFEAGDFKTCVEFSAWISDADRRHHASMALLKLCEAHLTGEALDCLLYVYEVSPCSQCRHDAVSALLQIDGAPAWVLSEAEMDADPETRTLVSEAR